MRRMTRQEAIKFAGSQVKLAAMLGTRQSTIASWGEYPPDARQLQIERVTLGALRAEPDCLDRVLRIKKAA